MWNLGIKPKCHWGLLKMFLNEPVLAYSQIGKPGADFFRYGHRMPWVVESRWAWPVYWLHIGNWASKATVGGDGFWEEKK